MMNGVTLIGLETHYYFRKKDNFDVSHANFKARNEGNSSKQIFITVCEFNENGKSEKLNKFYLYSEQDEIKNPFVLEPGEDLVFRITFPFHPVNPLDRKKYQLVVHAKSDSKKIDAFADIVCFLDSG